MRQIKDHAAALAALAALAVLASCSNDASPTPTEASAGGGSVKDTTQDPGYTLVAGTHLGGPGRWALRAVGAPDAPLAVLDVPAGYQGREDFVWTHDELDLDDHPGQILYQAPTRVFDDPCDRDRPSRRLGPTVEDLARALAAQKRTTTTRPVPVTLGGYRGLYLELTSSAGVDFTACDPEGGMLIFEAGPGGERVFEVPATERYWILDVDGRRLVVSAMTPAGARGESVARVTDVAEATRFVEAADPSGQ